MIVSTERSEIARRHANYLEWPELFDCVFVSLCLVSLAETGEIIEWPRLGEREREREREREELVS